MRRLRLILLACATLLQFMQPALADLKSSMPVLARITVTEAVAKHVLNCHGMQTKKTAVATQASEHHSNCCDKAGHCECAGGASATLPAACSMPISAVAPHTGNRASPEGEIARAHMDRLRPPITFLS